VYQEFAAGSLIATTEHVRDCRGNNAQLTGRPWKGGESMKKIIVRKTGSVRLTSSCCIYGVPV
jgi:hypothetical protein